MLPLADAALYLMNQKVADTARAMLMVVPDPMRVDESSADDAFLVAVEGLGGHVGRHEADFEALANYGRPGLMASLGLQQTNWRYVVPQPAGAIVALGQITLARMPGGDRVAFNGFMVVRSEVRLG